MIAWSDPEKQNIKNNTKLKEVVCDECNCYFGENLEISLARDTFEGLARFEHKVKLPNEYKSPGKKSRLITKVDEGPFKGSFAYREYSEIDGGIIIKPIPQIGFKKKSTPTSYVYYPFEKIPDKEYLEENYDLKSEKSIVILGMDSEIAQNCLAKKDIKFKPDGEFNPSEDTLKWGCEITCQIDQTIFRALAKIGFNYLAYWAGPEFVAKKCFHPVRQYIRYGIKESYPFVVIIEKAILGDEPVVGKRRVGHIITLDRSKDKMSLVSQVSLFNLMTYSVLLAENYNKNEFLYRKGSFFNLGDNKIYELTPGIG